MTMTRRRFPRSPRLLGLLALGLLALTTAAGAAITKGPWIVDVGERSATIKWASEGAEGSVEYGPTTAYGFTQAGTPDAGVFTARLNCVKPEELIHYRVNADGASSPDGTFALAPATGAAPFTFVAFGDVRTNHEDHQAVANAIRAEAPDFVVQTGDLVEIAILPSEWQTFFDVERDLLRDTPYVGVMGNHELWGGRDAFARYFGSPGQAGSSQFAVTWGNTRLIALDVTVPYGASSAQFDWMTQQLQAAADDPGVVHCIVILHYPPYSSSNHGNESDPLKVRAELAPVWEEFGVDLVLSGHDHNYERSEVNGRTYIVTGGGGAPLYGNGHSDWTVVSAETLHYCRIQVSGTRIDVTVLDPEGAQVDAFSIDQDFGGAGIPGHEAGDPCASFDYDSDGLTDGVELQGCTDPYNPDTDGDGYTDGAEVQAGSDPCDPESVPPAGDDDSGDDDSGDDSSDDDLAGDDDSGGDDGGCGC
jgi:Icc-related predicted phosphoesterase